MAERTDLGTKKEVFEYDFTDLYITAFLLCKGGEIKKISSDKNNNKQKTFTLIFKYEIEDILLDYHNEKARVNPKQYKNKIQDLKGIINRARS